MRPLVAVIKRVRQQDSWEWDLTYPDEFLDDLFCLGDRATCVGESPVNLGVVRNQRKNDND